MKIPRGRRVLAVIVVMLAAVCAVAWARSGTTVPLAATAILRLDTRHPGNEFALGAIGLSTEARELSTDHLSARHYRLVRLMRLLGPSVLRIGGNTVDLSWWTSHGEPPPAWATSTVTPANLSALRGLLAATGWRVLLGVDFGHFEPARAADEARRAREILGAHLLGIEIGNEPDAYGGQNDNLRPLTYSVGEYLREAEAYRQALGSIRPAVAVYGPALSLRRSWLVQMGTVARMFTQITQHSYPINTCPTTPPLSPQPTAVELLAPAVRRQENEILQTLALVGSITGRPTRIDETNSVACGGKIDASPGFAGALWSLDWILRAESRDVRGLNFHGGLHPCRSYPESPICAPGDEETADAGDVTAQPEYYGLLAARQLEGGRFVPTRLVAPTSLPNITTWATLAPDGTIRIAIDNFAISGLAQPVSIAVSDYTATEETLAGSPVDASSGIAFGGAGVTGGGRWRSRPVSLRARRSVRVVVRPASAVIVTLRPKHSRG